MYNYKHQVTWMSFSSASLRALSLAAVAYSIAWRYIATRSSNMLLGTELYMGEI